jgi:hypothetical protein
VIGMKTDAFSALYKSCRAQSTVVDIMESSSRVEGSHSGAVKLSSKKMVIPQQSWRVLVWTFGVFFSGFNHKKNVHVALTIFC